MTTKATTPITTVTNPRTLTFLTFLFGQDSPLKIGIVPYFVMLVKSPINHTNKIVLYLVVQECRDTTFPVAPQCVGVPFI
jgi:hypothetical protein